MLDLMVVMPIYNEQECIVDVMNSWDRLLSGTGATFRILALNDGSKDTTSESLTVFKDSPNIQVINKPNSGHGPTILMGYRMAIEMSEWVLQIDSDGEMSPERFPYLWEKRHEYDALFGIRDRRVQNVGRKLISAVSRITVRLVFGPGVVDVNTPYRLIRSDVLRSIIKQIPPNTFAPNIIISGAFAKSNARIYNVPVPHMHRKTGIVSIAGWKLWRLAVRSLIETLRCQPEV